MDTVMQSSSKIHQMFNEGMYNDMSHNTLI